MQALGKDERFSTTGRMSFSPQQSNKILTESLTVSLDPKSTKETNGPMLKKDLYLNMHRGFPGGSVVNNPAANAGDTGSILGPGGSHLCGAAKLRCHF